MAEPWAVRMRGVGKQYRIAALQARNDYFIDALMGFFRGLVPGLRTKTRSESFWALQDIDLDIGAGDTVGIVGRNGAGKSTLLKILSRVAAPTTGEVRYRGRLASLLEIGTGFHRELSGRENIYLNGTILGMRRAEIREHFDAIVAFAGIEQFLDTPVKFYSSGMYVRLAFAVAAHLRSDILVVDEVLAVGDAEFQRKCLGKMRDVAAAGRTVLFVSHNMGSVRSLCERALLLETGRMVLYGEVDEVVERYMQSAEGQSAIRYVNVPQPQGPTIVRIELAAARFAHDEPVGLEVAVFTQPGSLPSYVALAVLDAEANPVCFSRDCESDERLLEGRPEGEHAYRVEIPAGSLKPGDYWISCTLYSLFPNHPSEYGNVPENEVGEFIQSADRAVGFAVYDNGSVQSRLGFPWKGLSGVRPRWERVE